MSLTVSVALLALAAVQQQTDTTVAVPAGARLQLSNHAGSIRIVAWDRREMRVRAAHGSRDRITVTVSQSGVRVRADRRFGMPTSVDYDLSVPRDMKIEVDGVETDITVEGVAGDIQASSVEGDIVVRRAGGNVTVNTVEGEITIDGGRGRISVNGVDGDVRISNVQGDVRVETIDSEVTLENVDGTNVDVGTVDGTIYYRGTIRDNGRYRFTSHDGDVILAVPQTINATVTVATFDGSFEADPAFRVQLRDQRPGRRFNFVLGTGSARVELESFDGAIRLERR